VAGRACDDCRLIRSDPIRSLLDFDLTAAVKESQAVANLVSAALLNPSMATMVALQILNSRGHAVFAALHPEDRSSDIELALRNVQVSSTVDASILDSRLESIHNITESFLLALPQSVVPTKFAASGSTLPQFRPLLYDGASSAR
jgi:hypothetical protein